MFSALLIVVFVYQIDNNLHHHVFFFRPALGNHQREGNEGTVSDALAAVRMIENVIIVKEPEEQRGGNAFVTITERVVLRDKIE